MDNIAQYSQRGVNTILISPLVSGHESSAPVSQDDQLTETAPLLDGVTLFVDFRSGHTNLGRAIETKASGLGATISERLNTKVTHMIFKGNCHDPAQLS